MKLLIVINTLSTGGAERQAIQDANMLVAAGHEMTVAFGEHEVLIGQLNEKVRVIKLGKESELNAIRKLVSHLKKNKYDVIISHMFWANKVAATAGKLTGHRTILFEHGLGLWRKWYHLILVRRTAAWSKIVVTCSKRNKELKINREGIPAKKIRSIPNSFNPMRISDSDKNKTDDVFRIGFAGRFNKIKQLPLLVDIAEIISKTHKNFRFVLLGDGVVQEALENKIADKGLQKHFELPGYIDNPQNILVNFDAFVLPSKLEDFSLALLEASSAGLPCVAFDVGGNGEIILDGETGFVIKSYDINEFAEKLSWLIDNKDESAKMGRLAKSWVNKEFNTEKRVERLQKLIAEVTG